MCRLFTIHSCGQRQRHFLHPPPWRVINFNSRILLRGREEEEESRIQKFLASIVTRSFSVQHASPSRDVAFATVKRGVGNIVATTTSTGNTTFFTHLSKLSHRSPVRLIPTTTSAITYSKQVSIGHYGGGMTEGDEAAIDIAVEKNARLHVRTQGINRIYGHGNKQPYRIRGAEHDHQAILTKLSINSVEATVGEDGLLVYAPDPVSLHTGAQYQQSTNYILKDSATSNLIAIDWICSGRRYATESEHWNHVSCTTRTTLRFHEQTIPTLIDAQSITAEGIHAFATSNQQFHAVVTVILSGSMVVGLDNGNSDDTVVQRFLNLQSALASPYTSIRTTDYDAITRTNVTTLLEEQLSKGGRVVVGVSKAIATINNNDVSPVYTVRLVATSNEDIYRILHYCLIPIAPYLDGNECYKDRIVTSSKSSPTSVQPVSLRTTPTTSLVDTSMMISDNPLSHLDVASSHSNYWAAYMLADSALPIGSFAHSSGIEAASQLGFLQSKAYTGTQTDQLSRRDSSVAAYVRAAVTSTMQLSTPLLWCSSHLTKNLIHQLSARRNIDDGQEGQLVHGSFQKEYIKLDFYTQALLATNGPSCRASIDQGNNLWRVTQSAFLTAPQTPVIDQDSLNSIVAILERVIESSDNGGHMTTVLGVVSRLMQINAHDTIRLYGYCVARDVVNAAVRLNLIGPMEGQTILLQHARQASFYGISYAETAIASSLFGETKMFHNGVDNSMLECVLSTSIGSAAIMDSIHPCHDILATRLFRT